LDPLLTNGPLTALPDVALLTSLFGASCAGLLAGLDRIGPVEEPWENVRDGESGPTTLDLGLLLIVDSLLIQDPLDETDSLR